MLSALCVMLGSALVFGASARPSKPANSKTGDFARVVQPLISKYCFECHGPKQQLGGVALHSAKDLATVLKQRAMWAAAAKNLTQGVMPPKHKPQPTVAERERLITWIETTLSSGECDLRDPGRVTLRRLNREEYNNTVRDLFAVAIRPADEFPSDDVGYGFDNIGDVLTLSPLLLEKYLTAAEKVAVAAVWSAESHTRQWRFEAENPRETQGGGFISRNVRMLVQPGEVTASYDFPQDGDYVLRVRAGGNGDGTEPPRLAWKLDEVALAVVEVTAPQDAPKLYELPRKVSAGKHKLAVEFVNGGTNPLDRSRRRNVAVDYLEVVGPFLPKPNPLPASHLRLVTATPGPNGSWNEAAVKVLTPFAKRAFRRPVTNEEIARLAAAVELAKREGESYERGIQLAIQATLVSPHFLFRVELDPPAGDPKATKPLGDYELATRLSYFLWCSTPDDELLRLADEGKLRNPITLVAQAKRLLRDPKARALTDNFAAQWLMLRNLSLVGPDPKQFPSFDDELRTAMRTEAELFFEAIVRDDRSVLEFLDSSFTFLNDRLAQHYGVPGVSGTQFRRVNLTTPQRGGVLTLASTLTVTSNPTRTSPVKRGKWILEQLFGTPPPEPPPGVEELKEEQPGELTGTIRQKLEQHRSKPECATCHQRMDPLGFGLENYDAIGAWRVLEGRFKIDASGTLPSGQSFQTPAQLKAILKSQSKQFVQGFSEKLLTFALGRGLTPTDRCSLDTIGQAAAKDSYKFSALVSEIVRSEPFRLKRSEGAK